MSDSKTSKKTLKFFSNMNYKNPNAGILNTFKFLSKMKIKEALVVSFLENSANVFLNLAVLSPKTN